MRRDVGQTRQPRLESATPHKHAHVTEIPAAFHRDSTSSRLICQTLPNTPRPWPEVLNPYGSLRLIDLPHPQVIITPVPATAASKGGPLPPRIRRLVLSEWFPVLLITLLAAVLRLYGLDRFPPGLYHDEAANGLDALRVLAGQRPVFFEANNGREPLFIYLTAASISLLGRSPLAIRLVAGLLGTLTVPATYAMARAWLDRRTALLSALLTAITFWHLNLSRIGFRAVGLPLFSALTLLFLLRGHERRQLSDLILSGLFLGLSLYTYPAARVLPFVLASWIAFLVIRRRPINWAGFALLLAAALVVASPLVAYAIEHRETFLARSTQVSILNPAINGGDPAGALLRNTTNALGMFNVRGDFIPRHNMPLRPVFDVPMGIAFLLGVALSLRSAWQQPSAGLPLIFVLLMLAPTILAENAPHFLRSAGILPVLFIFPAMGLQWVWKTLQARTSASGARLGMVVLLAWSLYSTASDYSQHVQSEATYYNFESGVAELASEINGFLDSGWHEGSGLQVPAPRPIPDRRVYLDDRLWADWASLRYLVPESQGLTLLSQASTAPPMPSPDRVRLIVWPYQEHTAPVELLPSDSLIAVREGSLERGDLEEQARLLCVTYEASAGRPVPNNRRVRFEEGIELLGYRWETGEEGPELYLYWQATRPLETDYTVFVHWPRGSEMIAQSDSYPARAYYPTHLWRRGDVIEDPHLLATSTAPLPGDLVSVGMYSLQTMTRLQVLDASGAPTADHVTIELPQL